MLFVTRTSSWFWEVKDAPQTSKGTFSQAALTSSLPLSSPAEYRDTYAVLPPFAGPLDTCTTCRTITALLLLPTTL